jgi:hypothetical protein
MPASFMDPTATVEPPADLGHGCRVSYYVHAGQGAIVGAEWFDDEALSLGGIAVVATGARLFRAMLDRTVR